MCQDSDDNDGNSITNNDENSRKNDNNNNINTNDILREKYVKKYFGDWKCEDCVFQQNKSKSTSLYVKHEYCMTNMTNMVE